MEFDLDNLKKYKLPQLSAIASRLKVDISNTSQHLVHYLVEKDERSRRLSEMEKSLTDILKQYALDYDLDNHIKFSINIPQASFEEYQKWLNGWILVSRIGRGIPKQFRKRVWDNIATYNTRSICLESLILFHSKMNSRDNYWLEEINKTTYELHSKYVNHHSMVRVLLAYSRHNTKVDYTPELCILSSLILKIVEGEEELALKVLICLMDYKFLSAYFTQQLHGVHVEMIVTNDLLDHIFPQLAYHLRQLQTSNSSKICKSYSSNHPPSFKESTSHEPPLINAFTFRWFLFMFTHCLSWKSLRRLLDTVVLNGGDMYVYAGLAIWGIFERDLLNLTNVCDYYIKVDELEKKLKNSQLISSTDFMQMVYSIADVAASSSDIPCIDELRQKHSSKTSTPVCIPCPLPSKGGSVLLESFKAQTVKTGIPLQTVVAAKAECPQTIKKSFLFANAYAADIPDSVLAMYQTEIVESHCQLLKNGKTYSIM